MQSKATYLEAVQPVGYYKGLPRMIYGSIIPKGNKPTQI